MLSRKWFVPVIGLIVGFFSCATGWAQTDRESKPQQLSDFAQETVTISKMDWLLLKAEIASIREALKSQNPGRFSPPFYVYAPEKGKIVASTLFDSVWFGTTSHDVVEKEFMNKVGEYCAGTFMLGGFGWPPSDYCSVRFLKFTLVPVNDLAIPAIPKEIATWEGSLVFK